MNIFKAFKRIKPMVCLHNWEGAGHCVVGTNRVCAVRHCPKCDSYERLTAIGEMEWVPVRKSELPRSPYDVAEMFILYVNRMGKHACATVYPGNVPEMYITEWWVKFRENLYKLAEQHPENTYSINFDSIGGGCFNKPIPQIQIYKTQKAIQ